MINGLFSKQARDLWFQPDKTTAEDSLTEKAKPLTSQERVSPITSLAQRIDSTKVNNKHTHTHTVQYTLKHTPPDAYSLKQTTQSYLFITTFDWIVSNTSVHNTRTHTLSAFPSPCCMYQILELDNVPHVERECTNRQVSYNKPCRKCKKHRQNSLKLW